jgi:hypothetical protein
MKVKTMPDLVSNTSTNKLNSTNLSNHDKRYLQLGETTLKASDDLPVGTVNERYLAMMQGKYVHVDEAREVFVQIFCAGMDVHDDNFTQVSGEADPMYAVTKHIVHGATDAPDGEVRDALVNVLYVFYLLLVLFRLYDRTPRHQASDHMLNFVHDAFKLVRPLMFLPVFSQALRKLSAILLLVFGGRQYPTTASQAQE